MPKKQKIPNEVWYYFRNNLEVKLRCYCECFILSVKDSKERAVITGDVLKECSRKAQFILDEIVKFNEFMESYQEKE